MTTAPKQRPKYYDLNLAHLPVPGLVSIFHRVSGALLFFPVLPVLLYLLQSIREGTALQVEGDRMLLLGDLPGRGFLHGR